MGQHESDFSLFPSFQIVFLSESSWHRGDFVLSRMTSLFFLLLALISAQKSIAHESIAHAYYHRWISFALSVPPFPPPASVSNLKNTMSPHSSMLNTYPSNLQAAPITRICHGTHGLLLVDWSRGDRGVGWGGTSEHGGPGFGLF